MKTNSQNGHGFTLLELMVSMAVGLIVIAAMTSLFKTGLNSTMLVTQRAETQQNMRTAMDLMVKDISLAGAGLPTGGLQLPINGGATAAKYGCDQGGTCHVTTHTYAGNFMYGIIPGYTNGVEGGGSVPAAPSPTINDSITVAYVDYNFPLFQYNVTFPTAPDGSSICVTQNATFTPLPEAPNSAGALQVGDLVLINPTSGTSVVGEVTNVSGVVGTSTVSGTSVNSYTISFANTDPLNFNYSKNGTTTNNVYSASAATGYTCPPPVATPQTTQGVAYRLYVVTYYLNVPTVAGQTPRLMRQVNGLSPVPVADDIINLQFAYDSYNTTVAPATLDANQPNPLGVGESPNNFQKINIVVMGESILSNGNKSQNMYLATSVSARNMAFSNRYK